MNIIEAMRSPRVESQHDRSTRIAQNRRDRPRAERLRDIVQPRRRAATAAILAELAAEFWDPILGPPERPPQPPVGDLPW
jgi:hypothetical protein